MIRRSTIFLVIILVFTKCDQDSSPDLLPKYYSEIEIEELKKLADFIIHQTSSECSDPSTACLYQYFDQFSDLGANDDVEFFISKGIQEELLLGMDKNVFNDIWIYCEGTSNTAKDSLARTTSLCIRSDGRFAQLLKESSELNLNLRDYYDAFLAAGSYSPSMNTLLLKESDRFNLSSEHELLLLAVHLITLNHPVEVN